jgi:hypothetical protein
VERKDISETATQTVGVPDAAEVEANEAIDNAEDVQSTNRIYQFNNCQTVYMNSFNARGLNISNTAPRNSRMSCFLISRDMCAHIYPCLHTVAPDLEVSGKIEDIDDAANIRPTNAVYTKIFDNYNVTVKNCTSSYLFFLLFFCSQDHQYLAPHCQFMIGTISYYFLQ